MIGTNTGDEITSASSNVGIGRDVLQKLVSNGSNTAVGDTALQLVTGSNNTGFGKNALSAVQGGTGNLGLGYLAGNNITTGSGNVVIGNADVPSATGNDQLSISSGDDGSVVWITGSSAGVLTFNSANVTQQALTSSSNAVAWDASAKPNAVHITTENTTFSAPTNNVEGAFIALEINYNGSHTIAFNTVFEFAASTAPTFTSTDGKTDILVFRYNGAVWQEVGRTLNLSES